MMTTEEALARYLTQRGIIEPGDDREDWYSARWLPRFCRLPWVAAG